MNYLLETTEEIDDCMEIPSLVDLCLESFCLMAKSEDFKHRILSRLPLHMSERLVQFMIRKLHIPEFLGESCHLKIHIMQSESLQKFITFRCDLQWPVRHTIHLISEKCGITTPEEMKSFGLFQPRGVQGPALWLNEDKLLLDYDLKPHYVLHFKKRQTVIRVHFMGAWEKVVHPLHLSTLFDKTTKKFVVDESLTVSEIAQLVTKKLGIYPFDEYSLRLYNSENEEVGRWLTPDLSLPEQGVDPMVDILQLKHQFTNRATSHTFSEAGEAIDIDQTLLHLEFCHCLDAIIDQNHPCKGDEAALFAALQCQVCFGNYNKQKLDLDECLPAEYKGLKVLHSRIIEYYRSLHLMSENGAKLRYINLTRSLPTYSYSFYKVQQIVSDKKCLPVLLGVSSEGIMILDPFTKDCIDQWSIDHLCQWQVLHSIFSLYLVQKQKPDHDHTTTDFIPNTIHKKAHTIMCIEFVTGQAEVLSQMLSGVVHFNLRTHPSHQRRWSREFDAVGRIYSSIQHRRSSSTVNVEYSEDEKKIDTKNQIFSNKCRLYVVPKKLYTNPLCITINQDKDVSKRNDDLFNSFDSEDHPLVLMKRHRLCKLIKILAGLSLNILPQKKTREVNIQEIKIKLPMKSQLVRFGVDINKPVSQIVKDIGSKIAIHNVEEFSLQVPDGNAWLNPYQPLSEQFTSTFPVFYFKRKFYYNDIPHHFAEGYSSHLALMFNDAYDALVMNRIVCTLEEGVNLAGTLFQIKFGQHVPSIHLPGFLKNEDLKYFLPSMCLPLWGVSNHNIEKMIYKVHYTLRGMTEPQAKFRFLQLCRNLEIFGSTFFSIKQPSYRHIGKKECTIKTSPCESEESAASPTTSVHKLTNGNTSSSPRCRPRLNRNSNSFSSPSMLLYCSRTHIVILDAKTKEILQKFPLTHLFKWIVNGNLFTLDFMDYPEGQVDFYTANASAISQYLSDYVDLIQTKLMGTIVHQDLS